MTEQLWRGPEDCRVCGREHGLEAVASSALLIEDGEAAVERMAPLIAEIANKAFRPMGEVASRGWAISLLRAAIGEQP